MRLTAMTDYALRLLMYVAMRPESLCNITEIAEAYGISRAHLVKIPPQLELNGWIETVRGKSGGMRLAGRPGDISLGDVVRSVEPDLAPVECFATGSTCTLTGHCGLAYVIHDALLGFMRELDGHTLADVLPRGKTPPALKQIRFAPAKRMRTAR